VQEAGASYEMRHRDLDFREFLGVIRKGHINILTKFNGGGEVRSLYVGEIGGSLRPQVNGGAKFEKLYYKNAKI
jgi:hypothetical protein